MPADYGTPLIEPTVGGDENAWGPKLNAILQQLEDRTLDANARIGALGAGGTTIPAVQRTADPAAPSGGTTGSEILGAASTDFTGWDKLDPATITVTPNSPSAGLTTLAPTASNAIGKVFATTPNQQYRLDVRIRGTVGGEIAFLAVQQVGGSWGMYTTNSNTTLTNTMQTYSFSFTKPSDGLGAQALIGGLAAGKSYVLEYARVYPITPATVDPVTVNSYPTGYRLKSGATTVTGNQITMTQTDVLEFRDASNNLLTKIVARPGETLTWAPTVPPAEYGFVFDPNDPPYDVPVSRVAAFQRSVTRGTGSVAYSVQAKGQTAFTPISEPFCVDPADTLRATPSGVTVELVALLA